MLDQLKRENMIITAFMFAVLSSCEKIEEFPCPDDIPYQTTAAINAEKAERITEIIYNFMNSQELIGIHCCYQNFTFSC